MGIKRSPLKAAEKTDADKFIEGAEDNTEQEKAGKTYPWDDADPEVVKLFNLRLPKPLKLKIEYIINNTMHSSMHSFIMGEVEKAVERELKNLEKGK